MKIPEPTISVNVDIANPGQFFACCGLFELAQRVWPGAEGWFSEKDTVFNVHGSVGEQCTLQSLADKLAMVGIDGELSSGEREELQLLESRKRELRKARKELLRPEEERRSALGKRQREGAITVGGPFALRVAWWQEDGDDVPKTFAGKQEVLRMARAMLARFPDAVRGGRSPFDYRCLLQAVKEGADDKDSKVEPFYFDAGRFAHPLDAGFSLDAQATTVRASASPFMELLALVGLQRYRPKQSTDSRWSFQYWTWPVPLPAPVAAGVACGAVSFPGGRGYRFPLRFRDDQKRYKAFGFAIEIGGES